MFRNSCWIVIFATAAALTACNQNDPHAAATATASPAATGGRSYPINVVCTVGMVADIARNVGGDHVKVTALMGEGVDPHLYQASPGDVRLLSGADVVFYNGLLLEGKMTDVMIKLASRVPTVAVTEHIPEDTLRSPPEFAGHHDPHVWFDVSLWMKCAERVRDYLADEFDPAHRSDYERNAADYLARLAELHEYARDQIATIPDERRTLVTAHDAFGYFGRAYHIEVRAIQGLSTESEASVKDINNLVAFIAERKIRAVFVESSVSQKNIQALVEGCAAAGHAVTIGGSLFSDAMGKDGTPDGTYVGMVRHNVDIIVRSLK
ncbi:MAG: zinc ABC transporter solute-binding protein [Phycisphaerales bacterium]|nr:zinc ABC transporter solute-binding protein [Phycisphaerales bacterium]